MSLQQINNHNVYIVGNMQIVIRIEGVKLWFHLLIHSCYRQSLLCGACFGLLDCHISLVYTELWDVSPLVLHNLHPLLHIYHYF